MELKEIIVQRIRHEGPISFRDFMEACLYYPSLGYYTSPIEKVGAGGDFYTSASVSPAYGAMIGKELEQTWHRLGQGEFTIVEYGAGSGLLARDILEYLRHNEAFYKKLDYCIIERSAWLGDQQKSILKEKVSWHDSIAELSGFTGAVLSNELVDNFPVHQVVMQEELQEVFVDHDGSFIEKLQPASAELKNYFKELGILLPVGFRTEVNLDAVEWVREIAGSMSKGSVITIDYGFLSEEIYSQRRREGTLLCYYKHTINEDPYANIGKQDITTHINFSALQHWGNKYGLSTTRFTSQAEFLVAHGFREYLRSTMNAGPDPISALRREAIIVNALVVEMGQRLKVMIQEKE